VTEIIVIKMNHEIIIKVYRAFNARDIDAVLTLMHLMFTGPMDGKVDKYMDIML
jgi:hypothetical protein